ncbi:MAG: acetate--CoA ligase family protein [Verrucomicrobiaceae bacterium]|nr:acetate--CoA ligase family protein [Verrucomicrobiaceae bacterium]
MGSHQRRRRSQHPQCSPHPHLRLPRWCCAGLCPHARASHRLHWLHDTQTALADFDAHSHQVALPARTGLLSESEAKSILSAAGIPVVETHAALDEDAAVAAAVEIGFPVVLKLLSATITHKTEVGGVQLDLCDEAAVRAAWRSIRSRVSPADFAGVTVQRMIQDKGTGSSLGVSQDAQFGPVLLFGA